MRLGLQISSFDFPGGTQAIGPRLADVARAADDAGLASLWTMDHFFQIEYVGEVDEPMLEAYTTLGYLAAVTRRIRLGTLVTGVVYRYPGMLVKTVTTLDVLSGGRAYLGLGAAWFEREALGLGMPFPPLRDRFEQLEETLRIANAMWAGDMTPIRGRHYRLEEPLSRPQPLSQPHPPILIGGGGETKTLRLVAQYADACNLFAYDGTKPILRKLDVLKRHCESVGRPYESIERTALGRLEDVTRRGGLQRAVEACRELAQAGIQHLIVSLPDDRAMASLEILGRDVIPEVAGF